MLNVTNQLALKQLQPFGNWFVDGCERRHRTIRRTYEWIEFKCGIEVLLNLTYQWSTLLVEEQDLLSSDERWWQMFDFRFDRGIRFGRSDVGRSLILGLHLPILVQCPEHLFLFEIQWLTAGIIFVHSHYTFLVACNNRHFIVSKKKIGSHDNNTSNIFSQHDEFKRIFLCKA